MLAGVPERAVQHDRHERHLPTEVFAAGELQLIQELMHISCPSLLVMATFDLVHTWFVKSYQKLATEWVVFPFIVVAPLTWGMLHSVPLCIGVSTLIFVDSFYHAGVVKFVASGLTVQSTIKQNCKHDQWLFENADLIQIFMLENYLIFGNANSCLEYVQSMFDDEAGFDLDLLPIPKYLILDLSIVTGLEGNVQPLRIGEYFRRLEARTHDVGGIKGKNHIRTQVVAWSFVVRAVFSL